MLTILSVTSETHRLKGRRNGALLKEQVWFEDNKVVGYSLAYIDAALSSVSVPSPYRCPLGFFSLGSGGQDLVAVKIPNASVVFCPPFSISPIRAFAKRLVAAGPIL